MDYAHETSSSIGYGHRFARTIHIQCMDYDCDFAARRWTANILRHLRTESFNRRRFSASVWLAALHVVCVWCTVETGQHAVADFRYTHFTHFTPNPIHCVILPQLDSTRLIFATWWIFITILTSFYTANLTAFLTLSRFTLPINNWDDLYHQEADFVSVKGGCVEYSVLNVSIRMEHHFMMAATDRT